jgi:hypothetical protein
MQQTTVMGGFSDLKDILIKHHNIQTPKQEIRLYFSNKENQLLLHNYHKHAQFIVLVVDSKAVTTFESARINALIKYAVGNSTNPDRLLNDLFLSVGFFKF